MAERAQLAVKKPEVKRGNSAIYRRKSDKSLSLSSTADRILFLQRTAGNQAVQRLIRSGTLQAKLRIGQPGDRYEQEADRVADAVMRMPEPGELEEETLQAKPPVEMITPSVQRQVEEEELQRQSIEEDEEELQAKATSVYLSEVTPNLESRIHSLKGGGQPLPESDRAYFEPRFGRDFSQVRVHTDTRAAESARAVNARAFTTGRDVVFGAGQYAPGTTAGQRLLAHELTHVVQQTRLSDSLATLQRDPDDLPECPEREPGTEPEHRGDGWCLDDYYRVGQNPWHPGANHCYRSYNPSGQQCCYDRNGLIIGSGSGRGTPDVIGTAEGEDSEGKCVNSIPAVIGHFFTDVVPAIPGRIGRWFRGQYDRVTDRGARMLQEIQNRMMRNMFFR